MKTIVITGSTRGIGFGMARAFLQHGCNVVITGRQQSVVEETVTRLSTEYPATQIHGQSCEVGNFEQVQNLWNSTVARFGQVDIWINNAAITAEAHPLWELPSDALTEVVDTNILGVMFGCKVAIEGMIKQGFGHIYNMEGLGSGGEMRAGLLPYGMSKYAVRYLSKLLTREAKAIPVKVSTISPGMVTTELLRKSVERGREKQAERFFNILADKPETVTPWLAEHILNNEKTGAHINWLTLPKIIGRFLMSPLRKRDLFT